MCENAFTRISSLSGIVSPVGPSSSAEDYDCRAHYKGLNSTEGLPCFPLICDMVKINLFYCLSSPLCSEGIKISTFYCPLKEGRVNIKTALWLKVWPKLIKTCSLETSLFLQEEHFCNLPAFSSLVLLWCSSLIRDNTRCTCDKLFVGPLICAWLCSPEKGRHRLRAEQHCSPRWGNRNAKEKIRTIIVIMMMMIMIKNKMTYLENLSCYLGLAWAICRKTPASQILNWERNSQMAKLEV